MGKVTVRRSVISHYLDPRNILSGTRLVLSMLENELYIFLNFFETLIFEWIMSLFPSVDYHLDMYEELYGGVTALFALQQSAGMHTGGLGLCRTMFRQHHHLYI